MPPGPTVQDEAEDSDDSAADGIQGDDADQQECQHHEWSTALPGASSPFNCHFGNADEKRKREEHSSGLREPKPVTEPFPIASESRHG